jgi:hypothetical protein
VSIQVIQFNERRQGWRLRELELIKKHLRFPFFDENEFSYTEHSVAE